MAEVIKNRKKLITLTARGSVKDVETCCVSTSNKDVM